MRSNALQQITLPDLCGGINTHDPEYDIADNQSPDMLNLWYKDMALCKRPGQAWLLRRGDVYRASEPYNGARAMHAGTRLYRWNTEGMSRNIGGFDPEEGFPPGAEPGDYCTAGTAGTLRGVTYETGDTAICVFTGTQQIALPVTGKVTASGTVAVTVTGAGIEGLPLGLSVAVEAGDNAAEAAEKIRAALAAEAVVTALYTVSRDHRTVMLTQAEPGEADDTLSLAVANGTCEGLEAAVSYDESVWRNAAREIRAGVQDDPGVFCEFGDVLYYIDGEKIWEIAPDYTVEAVEPYVPVVMINAAPDLSAGDDNEAYNLIGAGFTVWYNGDGASTVYKLSTTDADDPGPLDDTQVLVVVDAEEMATGYTFDRVANTVTFDSPPPKRNNNVWITAYKTVAGSREKITGCKVAVRFGGEPAGVTGGTRVFVTANPNYPYRYWRSDIGLHVSAGMRYFPDTAEEVLDQNSEAITAAAKMGDELIIFKESSIFAVGYAFDGEEVYYPVRECHSAIGCDMPGSVQLIDNRLVFAHSKSGVHILVSTNNDLENIVKPISANINPLLLRESGLIAACSCDYDRYYWLCVNGNVYLWDYDTTPYYNYADYDKAQKRLAWYRFDGIGANEFFEDGGLCWGGTGGIAKFTKSRNDFGQPICAYFKSKAFDLGNPEEEKTFMYLYPSFSMDGNILATVSAGNERTDVWKEQDFDIRSFDWGDFNWSAFTWNRIKYAKTYAMRLNMRRAAFLQVTVSGGEIDRGVGLSGLRVTYYVNRKMKR
jgi:hypothetical protein